jgi:hypothetical protein
VTLKTYLVTVSLLSLSLLGNSCSTPPPSWHGKLWAGNSATSSIDRAQTNEKTACNDPNFDGYVCLTYEDLRELREILLRCKDWGLVQEAMPVEKLMELNQFLEQGLTRVKRQ